MAALANRSSIGAERRDYRDVDSPSAVKRERVKALVTGEVSARENAEADDYLRQSLNQVVLGDYSDDVTALGTGVSLAAGLTGVDIAADIRDFSANIVNWEFTWRHAGAGQEGQLVPLRDSQRCFRRRMR